MLENWQKVGSWGNTLLRPSPGGNRRRPQPAASILSIGVVMVMIVATYGGAVGAWGAGNKLPWTGAKFFPDFSGSGLAQIFGIDGSSSGGTLSGSTVSASLNTTSTHDLIIAFVVVNSWSPAASCSDASKLTWTQRGAYDEQSSYPNVYEFYAVASSVLASDKITCSTSASGNLNLIALAVSGANVTSPFDSSGSLPVYAAGANSAPSLSAKTSLGYDMIIGLAAADGYVTGTLHPGSGYTSIIDEVMSKTPSSGGEYAGSGAPGTYPVSFGEPANDSWTLLADAIRGATVGTTETINWAGYAAVGAETSVQQVNGSWIQPSEPACPEVEGLVEVFSFAQVWWVGIDGFFNSSSASETVEQIGTEYNCYDGSSSYSAFYEFYPAGSVTISSFTIDPGDHVAASVTYSASTGVFTLSIHDVTRSEPFATASSNTNALEASAECIVEIPGGTSTDAYPGDQTNHFGSTYTGVPNTCYAAIGSSTLQPFSALKTAVVEMVSNSGSGVIIGAPSSLSSGSFTVKLTPT